MARTRSDPVTTTVTMDAADLLVGELNTLSGIAWVRDAWENKAPENYGVVELNGAPVNLWADDKLLEQVFQLTVHAYVNGNRDDLVALVQGKLAAKCDSWSLGGHEFAYDIGKNHWWWNAQIIGPLQWTEAATNG